VLALQATPTYANISLFLQIESQEEVMVTLNQELRETRQAKALLEQEFQQYRDKAQVAGPCCV